MSLTAEAYRERQWDPFPWLPDTEKLAPLVARIGPEKQQFRAAPPELLGTRAS